MLAPFIALAARLGLSGIVQKVVGVAGAVLVYGAVLAAAFMLGQCDGRRTERARQDALRAKENVEALTRDAAAKDKADVQREADTKAVDENQEDLINAIQTVPDTHPDAVRVALGCERLRKQGAAEADLPSVCRSGGGGQAGSTP